ncbi:DnaJ-class molecular chaperone [Ensifer sp. LBL]
MFMQTCPACGGTGEGTNYRACGCADGKMGGAICPKCGGTGKSNIKENCKECSGTRYIWNRDNK